MSQPKQVSLMTDQHSSSTIATSTVVAESAGEYKIAQPSNEEIQYFANTEGIVHVFDFDYEAIEDYTIKLQGNNNLCLAVCCLGTNLCFWQACGKQNSIDSIHAKHIAITRDGIRFVHDTRKDGCRLDCDKKGKTTKTIPFDKLTDCDIEEPAGASGPLCCMVSNTLTKVNIDTASSGMQMNPQNGQPLNLHELQLVGLKDPHGFKSMVWRMKRSGSGTRQGSSNSGGGALSLAPSTMGMSRNDNGGNGEHGKAIVLALQKQNVLLTKQNELLETIANNTKSQKS